MERKEEQRINRLIETAENAAGGEREAACAEYRALVQAYAVSELPDLAFLPQYADPLWCRNEQFQRFFADVLAERGIDRISDVYEILFRALDAHAQDEYGGAECQKLAYAIPQSFAQAPFDQALACAVWEGEESWAENLALYAQEKGLKLSACGGIVARWRELTAPLRGEIDARADQKLRALMENGELLGGYDPEADALSKRISASFSQLRSEYLDAKGELLAANLAHYRRSVARAAVFSGRDPNDMKIVPATKTQSAETINALVALGIDTVGENRVQELLEKFPLVHSSVKWHFIGQLQTNKVKYIIDKVKMIQCLDRLPLAEEIDRQAAKRGIVMPCLIEINIARIATHGGVSPEDATEFAETVRARFPHIALKGIMGVLPHKTTAQTFTGIDGEKREIECFDYESLERAAEQMEKLSKSLAERYPDMLECSMGMSEDYWFAIRHGATVLRPGRVLFGERRIPKGTEKGDEQV